MLATGRPVMALPRGRQLFVCGQADDHGQWEIVELARAGVAPHAIPGVGRERGFAFRLIRGRHHRRVVDLVAGRHRFSAAPDAEYAIGAEEAEHAVLAQFRRFIAADEIGRVDRDHHDAGEASIGRVEPAAELQRPILPESGPGRGRLDREGIRLALTLEVVLVGDIGRWRRAGAGHDIAVAVRNTDDEQQGRRQQRPCFQLPQYGLPAPDLIRVFDELQGLIDFAQRAHDLRFISLGQFVARHRRGLPSCAVPDSDEVQGRPPDCAQNEKAIAG